MLLILAGVALNSIFGEGSLIGNAQNAVDEYNKKVEEERLALEQIEEYLKNEGVNQTAILQLVDKGEDFIKVKVDGENYEEFEFSIDNGEYVPADLPEYTFNNLEVTTVTGMDTLVEEGTMHTIKAKAKNKKTGEIEEINSIQVATDVLVELDQVQYFKYEETDTEVTITELVPIMELIGNDPAAIYANWDNFFSSLKETIVIPSYINNKPVTKVSSKFIKQVSNIDTYEGDYEYNELLALAAGGTVLDMIEYFGWENNTSGLTLSGGHWTSREPVTLVVLCVSENQMGRTIFTAEIGRAALATINLEIQNGIVKNGNVSLILPPTIKEIEQKEFGYNSLKKLKSNSLNLEEITNHSFIYDVDVTNPPYEVEVTLHRQENNANINNTTIYMLGQTNQEKEILKEQIGIDWNTFTQVKVQE